jgi:hypothetical protein
VKSIKQKKRSNASKENWKKDNADESSAVRTGSPRENSAAVNSSREKGTGAARRESSNQQEVRPSSDPEITPTSILFLNVPFQKQFQKLSLAVLAVSIAGRLRPVIVSQDVGGNRLEKLKDLIAVSRWSISDLTPVRSKLGQRLNMAIELGISLALLPASHILILDRKAHRLDRTASDTRGFDPKIYDGRRISSLLLELAGTFAPRVDPKAILRLYAALLDNFDLVLRRSKTSDAFSSAGWRSLVGFAESVWPKLIADLQMG